ncbi:leukocyte receptor cluster member 1 homolog [Drosophila tropicalis]|uniref:leukocyte receptor cluster member 1 homolog n=1 Tax=Drosophila tropicalis TaxID=46794 RepID=UPI0035ABA2E2
MNILPKKRWHVRTKDNIARVRRDEAAAAEEERKRQDKLNLAESEARINFLRKQSGLPETDAATTSAQSTSSSSRDALGVDLFADYKTHIKTTNKDLEKEQKEEQEKYEKQIGYLTYLGQDTNEALKVRSWYEVAPKRRRPDDEGDSHSTEKQIKQKLSLDPLTLINALIPPEKKSPLPAKKVKAQTPSPVPAPRPSKSKKPKKDKKKSKKHKKDKLSSRKDLRDTVKQNKRDKLERLRKERLRREAAERLRAEALFAPPVSVPGSSATAASTPAATPRIVQKYNSQFNPEIAKQNMV